ncbi:MAG: DUF5665 domain-containing protein [Patescibacteria group bacterium]|jgi:hypothetical protein|nr:DUF5665 domain-containing protein [Patescibacteria group bacterium]
MKKTINDFKKRRAVKKEAKNNSPGNLTDKEYEKIGRSMEQVYVQGYANKGRLFYMSFVKGIGYGLGIFIGGTIVVGIVLSLLTRFEEVPVLGELAKKINSSIEKSSEFDAEKTTETIERLKQIQEQQNLESSQ